MMAMFYKVVFVTLFSVCYSNLVYSTPIRQESSEVQGIEKSLAFDIGAPAKEDKADQSEGKLGSIWRLGKRQSGFGSSLAQKLEELKARRAAEKQNSIPVPIPQPAATVDPKINVPLNDKIGTTLIDKTGKLGKNLGDDGEGELEKKAEFQATLRKILKTKAPMEEYESPPGFFEKKDEKKQVKEQEKKEKIKIEKLVDSDKTVEIPEGKLEIQVVDNHTGNNEKKIPEVHPPKGINSPVESKKNEIKPEVKTPIKREPDTQIARSKPSATESPKIGQKIDIPTKTETIFHPLAKTEASEATPSKSENQVEKNTWEVFLDQLLSKRSTDSQTLPPGQRPGFSFSLFF